MKGHDFRRAEEANQNFRASAPAALQSATNFKSPPLFAQKSNDQIVDDIPSYRYLARFGVVAALATCISIAAAVFASYYQSTPERFHHVPRIGLAGRMSKNRTKTPVPLRSLTAFIEEFDRYFSGSTQLKCYRGQRDSAWPNVAGIFRSDFKKLLDDEKKAIRELISVQPHEFASDETMLDKLVRMQHFGLPTRLLDVSRNAMVALYFATDPGPADTNPSDGVVTAFSVPQEVEKYYDSDSVSCIANLANMTAEEKARIFQLKESLTEDLSEASTVELFNVNADVQRLLQFIRAEKSYFQPIMKPEDLFVPYYVHPKLSNRRILAQAGAFIVYGIIPPESMFRPYEIEEKKFVVPQDAKGPIRKALDDIGINESTLFPEIDKAAARIKDSYWGK